MKRRWLLVLLPLLLLLGIAYLGVSWYMASQVVEAERNPPEAAPDSVGLEYQQVSFPPRGWGFQLKGWYILSQEDKGTIVMVHGLDSNKGSSGVGALEIARDLHQQGFTILMFDLRAHGESEGDSFSGGFFEQDDVLGALDYLVEERGTPLGRIGLMGFSMGAATVLLTAAKEPRVAGVVADSSFADIRDLIVVEASDRIGLPQWATRLLMPGMVTMARLSYRINVGAIVPEEAVARLPFPVLIIHGQEDERVPPSHAQRIYRAARQEGTELWMVPGAEHARAYKTRPQEYIQRVTAYFQERLAQTEKAPLGAIVR